MSKYVDIQDTITEDDGFLQRIERKITVKLKRCPFCGTVARVETVNVDDEDRVGDYIRVYCPECGAHTELYETHEEAANNWNSRKPYVKRGNVASCPFCGGKADTIFADDADVALVKCQKCGAMSAGFARGDSAVKAWNRRI